MGVPCMRAVLRATLAARRKARPTAAENSFVSFFTGVRFMVLVPTAAAQLSNYHTRSRHSLKDDSVFGKIIPAAGESPDHISSRHVVSALFDPRRDTPQC